MLRPTAIVPIFPTVLPSGAGMTVEGRNHPTMSFRPQPRNLKILKWSQGQAFQIPRLRSE